MQALPKRPLSQPRVFVSHRMADVPYAERIAWLASRKAGLEYSLDVHDPRAASCQRGHSVRPSGLCHHRRRHHRDGTAELHARNRRTHAAAAEHVVATFAVDSLRARRAKKAGSVISRQAAGWFHPQVHPPESRGEYVLLADLCGSDADVERWLQSHAHQSIVAKAYHGAGTPNSLP
jgi:hypothetical protein